MIKQGKKTKLATFEIFFVVVRSSRPARVMTYPAPRVRSTETVPSTAPVTVASKDELDDIMCAQTVRVLGVVDEGEETTRRKGGKEQRIFIACQAQVHS
jgi:hypothetical protein